MIRLSQQLADRKWYGGTRYSQWEDGRGSGGVFLEDSSKERRLSTCYSVSLSEQNFASTSEFYRGVEIQIKFLLVALREPVYERTELPRLCLLWSKCCW